MIKSVQALNGIIQGESCLVLPAVRQIAKSVVDVPRKDRDALVRDGPGW